MGRLAPLLLTLVATALLAGCSRGDDDGEAAPARPLVPPAQTQQEWADRLALRFFVSIERDLQLVNALATPPFLIGLQSGDPETASAIKQRMSDLQLCSFKLARVGPPPRGNPALARIHRSLARACVQYERMAAFVLEAVPLLSARDPARQREGRTLFNRAKGPSSQAARHYGRAIEAIQRNRDLRELVLGPEG